MNEVSEEQKITSPIKAIKAKCLDCCCGDKSEVRACPATNCPLWDFRLGKNPNRKRTLTDEQREAARLRLAKAREVRSSKSNLV